MAYGIDIDQTFTLHPPNDEQRAAYDNLGTWFTDLASYIDENTPQSPEQTLALRKLQESFMYCYAAVAIHGAPAPKVS